MGYTLLYDSDITMPAGISINDAWRVSNSVDVISEVQFNHGSLEGLGVNAWGLMAGIRGSGRSRYGEGTSVFGQVMVGLLGLSASFEGNHGSTNGLGIEPGFGVEIGVTPKFAIRPQFDYLIGVIDGTTTKNPRFGVSAVFRLLQ